MIKNDKISSRSAFLSCLLILAGLLVLLSGIPVTYMDNDEAYQALSCISYRNSPLAMLCFAVGNLWMRLFGDSLFSLRFLAFLCYLSAIGTGCIYLYKKTSIPLVLVSSVFLISCLAANIGGFRIYNWDTGAYPSEVIALLSFFLFINRPTRLRAIFCGAAIGLMTLYRIPLICFIFLFIPLVFLTSKKGNRFSTANFKMAGLTLLSMAATILIGGSMMCGSPSTYIASFNSENIITGHAVDSIGRKIWHWKTLTPRVVINWMPLLSALACCIVYIAARRHKRTVAGFGLLFCAVISWCLVKLHGQVCLYADPWFTIGLPLCCIPAFYPMISNFISAPDSAHPFPDKTVLKGVCVGLLPLFIALGSDTLVERLNASFAIPFAVAVAFPYSNEKIRSILFSWLRFSLFALAVVWIFMMWHALKESKPIDPPIPYHQHTLMRKFDADMFHDMQRDIAGFAPDTKYSFWGSNRYMFLYTYGRSDAFPLQKFHIKDMPEPEMTANLPKLDYLFLVYPPDNPEAELKNVNRWLMHSPDFVRVKKGYCYSLFKHVSPCRKDTVE